MSEPGGITWDQILQVIEEVAFRVADVWLGSVPPAISSGVGLLFLIIFTMRWHWDHSKRRRERGSVQSAKWKYLTPTGRGKSYMAGTAKMPSVAFIMPVKWGSIKAASPVDNWRSQVLTAYKGDHESVFVVESEDDGAVPILEALQEELKGKAVIRIAVAGLSKMCAQKIHNMVAGVNAASPNMEYILFLDANGHMHEGTVSCLVETITSDRQIFAVSGFPLDIPQPGASVWAWTMCQYRYIVLSEFANHRTTFPWGGCLLMRKQEIDNDVCEIKTRWLNGGYSDDLLVGAAAMDHDRTIATPLRALFPNTVKKDVTFAQAWDFMRRQAFTLITYSSVRHCMNAMSLLVLYGISGFIPLPALIISLLTVSFTGLHFLAEPEDFVKDNYILWVNLGLSVGFLFFFALAMIVQRRYLKSCWKMAQSLSPNSIIMDWTMTWYQQIASFLLETMCAPFITLSIMCNRSSVWGGITYHVRGGRVVRLERPKPSEPSKPGRASKAGRKKAINATELAQPISFSMPSS